MSNDEFENEDFTETKKVEDHPLTEEEPRVGVILASERIDVRHYPNMTIQDALNQVKGSPEGDKFRLLLDGAISSLDTVIPNANSEVIFVGNWVLGNQKKI